VAVAAPEPQGADAPTEPTKSRRALRSSIEWVAVLAVAAVVAILLRTFVVQTYFIPSLSMYPTLLKGDHIVVLKAAYDFTSPATGDVIVFKAPPRERELCDSPGVNDLVKRIIAIPGETVWSRGNTIYLMTPHHKAHALVQDWQHVTDLQTPVLRQTVPSGDYFVMGDNHPASCDSRVWGYVPRGSIIGKAVLIYWPLSRLSTI
jgi:signal peptidase I